MNANGIILFDSVGKWCSLGKKIMPNFLPKNIYKRPRNGI